MNSWLPTDWRTDRPTLVSIEMFNSYRGIGRLSWLKFCHASIYCTITLIYYRNYVKNDYLNSMLGTDWPTDRPTLLSIELLLQLKMKKKNIWMSLTQHFFNCKLTQSNCLILLPIIWRRKSLRIKINHTKLASIWSSQKSNKGYIWFVLPLSQ